ncbi:hypothetical protein BHM03_00053208, partial [Ensete ventricosum]
LYAIGYYLNPEFFYKIKYVQDKIIRELSLYKNAEGLFDNEDDRLRWVDVARASGVGELQIYIKQMMKRKMSATTSSSAPDIVENIENETYSDDDEGLEEEDKLNKDDLFENDDNINYDE